MRPEVIEFSLPLVWLCVYVIETVGGFSFNLLNARFKIVY